MLLISGSIFDNSDIDYVDNSNPLTTTSCGHYSLFKKPCLPPAVRPDARITSFYTLKTARACSDMKTVFTPFLKDRFLYTIRMNPSIINMSSATRPSCTGHISPEIR